MLSHRNSAQWPFMSPPLLSTTNYPSTCPTVHWGGSCVTQIADYRDGITDGGIGMLINWLNQFPSNWFLIESAAMLHCLSAFFWNILLLWQDPSVRDDRPSGCVFSRPANEVIMRKADDEHQSKGLKEWRWHQIKSDLALYAHWGNIAFGFALV